MLTGINLFLPPWSGTITTAYKEQQKPDLSVLLVLSKMINISKCFPPCVGQIVLSHLTGIGGAFIPAHYPCSDRNLSENDGFSHNGEISLSVPMP